jgi:hypothetical protein
MTSAYMNLDTGEWLCRVDAEFAEIEFLAIVRQVVPEDRSDYLATTDDGDVIVCNQCGVVLIEATEGEPNGNANG